MPMSNIASLRRTDAAPLTAAFTTSGIVTAIATMVLTIVIVSFRPFQPAGAGAVEGGDIVNQLGFGSLGAFAIFSLATMANPGRLRAIAGLPWIVLLCFFLISVGEAADPSAAFRAASFTLIGIIAMATVLALPRDGDSFSTVLVVAGFLVVGLSYAGVILYPSVAIHGADGFEPEHSGLWRGAFSHKNIAAPVMACFSFAGIYLIRRHWRWSGYILLAMSMFFMIHTGSKTTAGLVPLSIMLVLLPGVVGMRLGTPVLFALAVIGTALATLGIVFIEPLKLLAAHYFPELTYTGRTTVWAFAGEMIAQKPWFGYGYESFWRTPLVTGIGHAFDQGWDIRFIVHGHNGYIDIAVTMGLPALAVAVYVFLIAPLRDYLRIPLYKENVFLGDFFMMVVLFTALNAFLESFFFRRIDPVWMFFVLGVLGLRMVSRMVIHKNTG